ncbi:ferric reductase like transmembrane component-domain-containing protein [Dactylonectria estremocensis]|uniref:Ferric reductase like transmembrane component-domain-containing protein n=1 Tax=Dactylonectria estremocensis TaxID=1079267 RepID=A0A9P9E244_9HYPO|nr:ferric reductase like transmembrane component-domain-containing protein [Dactylonectria estremocensis]
MKLTTSIATAAALLLAPAAYAEPLVGYGTANYDIPCLWACEYAVPTSIDCPEFADMTDEERASAFPSPACFANSSAYLTSMAWCMHERCDASVKLWQMDHKWEEELFYGSNDEGVVLLYSYSEAVDQVDPKNPPLPMGTDLVLNRTISLTDDEYIGYLNAIVSFAKVAKNEATFSLVVFLGGAVAPVALSLLRLLPWPAKLSSKFYAYFIDPPVFGRTHNVPVLGLAMIPTRGQAIFIVYIIVINTVASFVGYPRLSPNSWYPDRSYELTRHIANRLGMLSFANIPLTVIYGGRNNLLMWMTNWSQSTFLLLHRWIAFTCTMQACLHSAMWLQMVVAGGYHASSAAQPYWYWGIIGTLALSLLIPLSMMPLRKYWYEIFLIGHIALAIVAITGSWYHILFLYDGTDGYDIWLFTAMAVWAFDRLLRLARMTKHGIKRAYITKVDDEYIRIDVPGVECTGYCYAYFPTVSWRVWENHPFSVVSLNPCRNVSTSSLHSASNSNSNSDTELSSVAVDAAARKEAGVVTAKVASTVASRANGKAGITMFVKVHKGLTQYLAAKCGVEAGVPILIEGSYGHEGRTSIQGTESKLAPSPDYPNLLVIAGGVGVTAVIPALERSLSLYEPIGTTKFYWGSRNQGLVDSIEGMLLGQGDGKKTNWGRIESHITVGSRINVREILESELGKAGDVGTTVVVCGPLPMLDEVRYNVAALARHGAVVRLMDEAIVW